jgi:hypothetical protein
LEWFGSNIAAWTPFLLANNCDKEMLGAITLCADIAACQHHELLGFF